MTNSKINPKQERFCLEYVKDLNATQAAIRAGYSKKTAAVIANENLIKPYIKSRINELQKKISDEINIDAKKAIEETAKIAFSNIEDFVDENFEVIPLKKIGRDKTAAIESIQVTTTTRGRGEDQYTERTVKFKLHGKNQALDMLHKIKGNYEEDNSQKQQQNTNVNLNHLSVEQLLKIVSAGDNTQK